MPFFKTKIFRLDFSTSSKNQIWFIKLIFQGNFQETVVKFFTAVIFYFRKKFTYSFNTNFTWIQKPQANSEIDFWSRCNDQSTTTCKVPVLEAQKIHCNLTAENS